MIFEQEDGREVNEDNYIKDDIEYVASYKTTPYYYFRDINDAMTYVYTSPSTSTYRWYN